MRPMGYEILAKKQSTLHPEPTNAMNVRTSALRENFSMKLKENYCASILIMRTMGF